ncbi:hypothetical protein Tco_1261123 [Tanacetum coccineum]
MVVKKDNGKWKLRVNFTNINKACIREHHPLPAAEQKAKDLHKYRLKCFLDAYKGYHQILIAEKGEEKTAFFTREGVFCYKRLPFSLKNAGGYLSKDYKKSFRTSDRKKYGGQLERIFKKKAKNGQTKHGMEKTKSIRSQSQSKSKVSHMKKIQLEGLKLPNLKLRYKKSRAEIENCG